ncbi:MAG: saccharopine dehydrogenase family protein [Bacillota bacterium]
MKVLAIGGCGQEGKTVVKELVESPEVSSVVVADINIENAKRFEAQLGSKKLSSIQLDVNDRERLIETMKAADVVASFVGPYFKYGVPVIKAAIEAGKNYVDINDDHDATRNCLALDDLAKRAGITALIGMGASPGATNLFAKYGADKLDQVEEIAIRWIVSIADVEDIGVGGTTFHTFHIVDGNHPQFLDGKWVDVPGLSGAEIVEFPLFGKQETYYTGHSEPVTLPLYIKGVQSVTCKGAAPGFNELWMACRELGITGEEPIEVRGMKIVPAEFGAHLIARMPIPDASLLPPPNSAILTTVKGTRGDEKVQLKYTVLSPLKMSSVTGIPCAIGILMMGRGDIKTKGVFAPEGCVDPKKFLAETAKRGIVLEEAEEIVRIVS